MNERIVKLFMKSVDSNYIPLPIEDHIPSWTEKFAELIVQECALQCNEALVPHTGQPSMTHNYAVGLCQDKIREHFGVEE